MTPRKPNARHRSQNSQSHLHPQAQPSDYESEAPFVAPPTRTNADLNLSVLRRYSPSIQTILSIAASAVIYNFVPPDANNSAPSWDRAEVEGTLFVCETFPNPATGKEGCCIVVLNKKSLENLIIDLREVQDVEDTREFLILRFRDRMEVEEKVIGVFIHPDKEDTRELNSMLVRERWEAMRAEGMRFGMIFMGRVMGRMLGGSWTLISFSPRGCGEEDVARLMNHEYKSQMLVGAVE